MELSCRRFQKNRCPGHLLGRQSPAHSVSSRTSRRSQITAERLSTVIIATEISESFQTMLCDITAPRSVTAQ